MPFTWSKNISVADATLDEQHKKLLAQIEVLHQTVLKKQGNQEVSQALLFLDNYILTHLLYEENYMLRHKYPDFYSHRDIHSEFMRRFNDFKRKFAADPSELIAKKIYLFLGEWWLTHIGFEDEKYQSYISGSPQSHPTSESEAFHTTIQDL